MQSRLLIIVFLFCFTSLYPQNKDWQGKFEQLDFLLPSANEYRNGSGAPGAKYWQQFVDYQINISLDEQSQSITGEETITYQNNSPDVLNYLWLQLDQNIRKVNSDAKKAESTSIEEINTTKKATTEFGLDGFNGGFDIIELVDEDQKSMNYLIHETMMRVDLDSPLLPNDKITFKIKWRYNIQDRMLYGGRSGYEYFPEEDNYIFTIGQFYPRMCVFDDVEGWQNKQFTGSTEFALPFGNFDVSITVPSDHIVAASGTLVNAQEVLTNAQFSKFQKSKSSFDQPIEIITKAEAIQAEKSKSKTTKTWHFQAYKVRDFAFASSRKFIWEAQAVKTIKNTPLAMIYYPKEGSPLWKLEALKAIKNTLEFYSEYCFDYPYPVAQVVNSANIGMEYPMISFNRGRASSDGSYSDYTKFKTIETIIHEIGHNWFPMIVNSDECKWPWMDEGINTFLENEVKVAKYDTFPSSNGDIQSILKYMKDASESIMSGTEESRMLSINSYYKSPGALTILRETVMGPELFDEAFKEYCKRWAFKHPKPADFFRTMEDASGFDLDWFWRGWFYSTDYVDLSIDEVVWYRLDATSKYKPTESTGLFIDEPRTFSLKNTPQSDYREFNNRVDDAGIKKRFENKNLYEITFSNLGGLVMPLIIEFTFADDSKSTIDLPAEIWRNNELKATKLFIFDKEVINVVLDPEEKTSDVNVLNNYYPRITTGSEIKRSDSN